MLDDFANAATDYFNIGGATSIAKETTTTLRGGAALKFSKDTSGTTATVMRFLAAPLSLNALRGKQDVKAVFFHRAASYTNVTKVEMLLAYDLGANGVTLGAVDPYGDEPSFTAGAWNKHEQGLFSSDNNQSEADRAKVIGLGFRVTTSGNNAVTDLLIGAALLVNGVSLLDFGGNRLLVPWFSAYAQNWEDVAETTESVAYAERQYQSSRIRFSASWFDGFSLAKHPALVESLRRFDRYAQGTNGWALGLHAGEEIDTTIDATSGAGESDPRVLNVASTAEAAFVMSNLGRTDILLAVGPNVYGQSEIVTVPAASYISAGVSITAEAALAFTYESGDPVRSYGFHPSCVLRNQGSAVAETPDSVSFALEATRTGY